MNLFTIAKELLIQLIQTPSLSRQENETATLLQEFFETKGIAVQRIENNVIVRSKYFDSAKPTILLNSHHDTVKPIEGWNTNPFEAVCVDGKIIGLGSNDAGAPLVSLIATFLHFYDKQDLPWNLMLIASAEEEVSGTQGMEFVLPQVEPISCAIIGEPTMMRMATAEKGLLVLDCVAQGVAGHAAHCTGENAIYKALQDITWFQTFQFPKQTELLGPVKMTVTCISSGTQHNVIPAECKFTVDIRTNECYSNQEVFNEITKHIQSIPAPRSFRLNSSAIEHSHPLVLQAQALGIELYGSPTMSDQVFLLDIPSVKMGPGSTFRSHTANEFVLESEIEHGIQVYISLLEGIKI